MNSTTQQHSQSLEPCSFCLKSREQVAFTIDKPGVSICNECVTEFGQLLQDAANSEPTELFRDCSFCSFMRTMLPEDISHFKPIKGRRLIRRGGFAICDYCVEVCEDIATEHNAA